MKNRSKTARGLLVIGFASALLASLGCGGSSGDGDTVQPAISCRDSGVAGPNTVIMTCGAALDNATERVDVTIGGPTTGMTTLRGFSFTITYDPTKLEFVPTGPYTSPLIPSALVLLALGNGQQGSVVVGIAQVGTEDDVDVTSGEHLVLSLSFRRVAGATFDPTPLMFDMAEATHASATVTFVDGLALGYPQ